ncbi:unnamed protein product [Schistosoma curassoni]|uniref:Fork-head domain-containing protein n=1 Tax=Schistosoma curassoni TaxID=6186 RepID=A0A183KJ43_9TREM|nr:unnamed protein product [Schistosoma curassoni]
MDNSSNDLKSYSVNQKIGSTKSTRTDSVAIANETVSSKVTTALIPGIVDASIPMDTQLTTSLSSPTHPIISHQSFTTGGESNNPSNSPKSNISSELNTSSSTFHTIGASSTTPSQSSPLLSALLLPGLNQETFQSRNLALNQANFMKIDESEGGMIIPPAGNSTIMISTDNSSTNNNNINNNNSITSYSSSITSSSSLYTNIMSCTTSLLSNDVFTTDYNNTSIITDSTTDDNDNNNNNDMMNAILKDSLPAVAITSYPTGVDVVRVDGSSGGAEGGQLDKMSAINNNIHSNNNVDSLKSDIEMVR